METNKIYNMDCYEGMKLLADKSIDLIITDPPYEFISKNPNGAGFMKKEKKEHIHKVNTSIGMSFNPIQFLESTKRILKHMNMYVFCNKKLLLPYLQFIEDNNYSFDILLWAKPNPVPIFNGHYLIDKEYLIYIREKGAVFNSDTGYENYFTIFNHSIGSKKFDHPTVKPIKFIKKVMRISSNENDIILDPFMGSGTTAVACKELNRQYIGFEIQKQYCEIANKRLQQQTLFDF